MLTVAIIVFREVLEAALVVSVVMAATKGLAGRGLWVGIGVIGGILGASLVAAFARVIAHSFSGAGQEIVNATLLLLAVLLIAWHVIWMSSHGRQMAKDLREAARLVAGGQRHMSILAIVVGFAVMREGSEIVLILGGLAASGQASSMLIGGLIGVAGGVATGFVIYRGFVALPLSYLFTATNGILVLIAAGMAAHAANFLSQADLLPELGTQLWDTSFILTDDSVVGKVFGAMLGYIAQPSGIEVLFYVATIAAVSLLVRLTRHTVRSQIQRKPKTA